MKFNEVMRTVNSTLVKIPPKSHYLPNIGGGDSN
jgi:hypothetical protein